jgi:peptidoglycan/LPS O-acetylase OafA/YrhL
MQTNPSISKPDFKIIDWMRGLAALYVVINHSCGNLFSDSDHYSKYTTIKANWSLWEWANIIMIQHSNLGTEFVILFFVLSGFSIAHSLGNNDNILDFYTKRLVRLYPPYLLGILWAIVVFVIIRLCAADVFNGALEGENPIRFMFDKFTGTKTMLLNFFYVPTDNYLTPQYWSLPFEIIFYLSIPFLIRKLKLYGIISACIFLAAWVWHGNYIADESKVSTLTQYLLDYNIYFFAGCLIYRFRDQLTRFYPFGRKTSLAILAVLFEAMVIIKGYVFHEIATNITNLIMAVFCSVLLFSAFKHQIRIGILEKIGSFSYTLYVTHFASIYLIKIVMYRLGYHFYEINVVFAWYFGIILSIILAYGLYFLAEAPSIALLKKLREEPPKTFRWKTRRAY